MESMPLHGANVLCRMMCKPLLLGLAGLMLSASGSNAQNAGEGYFVVGAGGYSNALSSGRVLQLGGGGEALIQNRFGIGGELGLARGGGDAWATFSVNASVHFPRSGARNGPVPFISAGYTRMAFFTEPGGTNAFNIRGGLTYWFNDRNGLSVEFCDVVYHALGTSQYWGARVGIAFR